MFIDQLFMKANAKHLKGNYQAAAKLYRDLLKIKPDHLDANYLLGTLFAETGQVAEARQYLEKADSINPTSPFIKVNLGNIYKLQGDFENSKKLFSTAIALKDDLSQAHFGLGSIYEYFDNDLDSAYLEYQKAVELSPNDPTILQAIGKTLAKFSNESAVDYLSRALLLDPKLKGIQKDIGLAYLRFGQTAKAAKHLNIAHLEDMKDVELSYFLCIAEGREPDKELQHRYIQEEFNSFADSFDDILQNKLGYDIPSAMIKFMKENIAGQFHFSKALDLGCGTGIFGALIKGYVDHLTGIDISRKMIAQAQKRDCYDTLVEGEILSALKGINNSFELFSATDVFIYIGDLKALFSAIKEKAAPNALFLLTTEAMEGEQFILRSSGRYAHSHNYIESTAAANGFDIIASRETPLRKEGAEWLTGEMFILRASS